MSRWLTPLVLAAALAVAVGASLRFAALRPPGAALEPARLELRPGESTALRVVLNVPAQVAVSFRLRFDPALLRLEPAAESPGVLAADGRRLVLPVRRAPGLLEVPGIAVTGSRTLAPEAILYEVRVEALSPGTTAIRVEDFTVVDTEAQRAALEVLAVAVTVRPS